MKTVVIATCSECEAWTPVSAEREHGTLYLDPQECPVCGKRYRADDIEEER